MKQHLLIVAIALALIWPTTLVSAQGNGASTEIVGIMDDGSIVLGDVVFKIASNARFFDRDERTPISLASFQEGDWVEFSVNPEGEIDEMWLSSE